MSPLPWLVLGTGLLAIGCRRRIERVEPSPRDVAPPRAVEPSSAVTAPDAAPVDQAADVHSRLLALDAGLARSCADAGDIERITVPAIEEAPSAFALTQAGRGGAVARRRLRFYNPLMACPCPDFAMRVFEDGGSEPDLLVHAVFSPSTVDGHAFEGIERAGDTRYLISVGWLVAIACLSCRPTGAEHDPGPSPRPGTSATVAIRSSSTPDKAPAPAQAPKARSDAGARPSCEATAAKDALDDVLLERSVFRQVAVGMITEPLRLTWILSSAPAKARLTLLCQRGISTHWERGKRLNGTENDESVWGPPVLTTYAGPRTRESPLSFSLDAVAGSTGEDGCAAPVGLLLSCQRGSVPTLAAGAVLEPSGREGKKGRWRPPAVLEVAALICDVTQKDGDASDKPFKFLWPGWRLAFAPRRGESAGVEWAFENSDTVVQEGAYRFLPAPGAL